MLESDLPFAGKRFQIDYFDQNESFANSLPRTGSVVSEHIDSDGNGPWLLLRLEAPFEYQLKMGAPLQFRLARIDAFVILFRWQGHNAGDMEDVSVFILLVEEGNHPTETVIASREFLHIAWGTCRSVA